MKVGQHMDGYNTSSRYEVEIVDGNDCPVDKNNLLSIVEKVWIDFYFPAYRYGLVYQLKYLKEYSSIAHTSNCSVLFLESRSVDDHAMTTLCRKVVEPNLHKYLQSYVRYFLEKYNIRLQVEVED